MKFLIVISLFVVCSSTHIFSQEYWFVDKEKALKFAKENDSNILMVFAGSDWCRPCKKLKKDVLDTTPFQDYAKDNLAILYLDFPAKKKNRLSKSQTQHNEQLAESFNKSGVFPKMILLDQHFKKIKEVNYTGQGVSSLISAL